MSQQVQEIRATRQIKEIKDKLDELVAHPQNYDTIKLAVEIYEIIEGPSDYVQPSWHHRQNILGVKD